MSGSTRLDVAALAASGVLTADELMKAVEANHKHCSDIQKHHLTHAAISAAVAVGAFELLRRDREKGGDVGDGRPVVVEEDGEDIVVRSEKHRHDRHYCHHNGQCDKSYHSPHSHKRRLLEEIAGAYSLGEEMIGNQKHHVAHLVSCHISDGKTVLECRLQPTTCKALTLDQVAEAIGAIGAYKDISSTVDTHLASMSMSSPVGEQFDYYDGCR
jgi:hypothetical protein